MYTISGPGCVCRPSRPPTGISTDTSASDQPFAGRSCCISTLRTTSGPCALDTGVANAKAVSTTAAAAIPFLDMISSGLHDTLLSQHGMTAKVITQTVCSAGTNYDNLRSSTHEV